MFKRRDMLTRSAQLAGLLAAAGLLPGSAKEALAAYNTAAFETRTLAELAKALGGSAPAQSKDVAITGPDIAENGAAVDITVATSLPGVKRLMVLVDKNPNILSAMFEPSDAVEANFALRVKMSQSANVYAVAQLADGKLLFAQKEIKVTLGGCGG